MNSSNSSKPPSSDIVKPPKPKQSSGPPHQGGQPGHKGSNREPFRQDQIDKAIPLYTDSCHCSYVSNGEPIEKPKIQQTVELVDNPVTITEYRLYGFIYPKCGRIVWAKLPAGVIEGQLFGLRLQTLPPKSATLAKRFCKYGDSMFRFLFDPAVVPTMLPSKLFVKLLLIGELPRAAGP